MLKKIVFCVHAASRLKLGFVTPKNRNWGFCDVREKVDSLYLSPIGCVLIVKIVCCSPVEAYAFTLPIPH